MRLNIALLLPFIHLVASQSCYWPSGSEADSLWVPCSIAGLSQCCARGEACLTNGMCYSAGIAGTYRGACTDKTWTTGGCPQYCKSIWNNGSAATTDCPVNGTQTLWGTKFKSWCGGDNEHICQNSAGGELFDMPTGNVSGIAGQSSASGSFCTASPGSRATSIAAGASPSCDSGKVSKSVPIGVGVGIGVPLALLSALLGCLYLMERKKSRVPESQPAYAEMQDYKKAPVIPAELHADSTAELEGR